MTMEGSCLQCLQFVKGHIAANVELILNIVASCLEDE